MVDAEFEAIWNQLQEDREKGVIDPEDADKDEEVLKQEYREIAERRVRLGLLLSEVGRINGIEVTQDELNRALAQEAQRHPGHEREVFEFFQKTPEAMANLRAPIFEDKVIDFITALAKVTERSMSPKELQQETTAEQDSDAKPEKKVAKKAPAKKGAGKKAGASKAAGKSTKKAAKES
jgi:trigger factor